MCSLPVCPYASRAEPCATCSSQITIIFRSRDSISWPRLSSIPHAMYCWRAPANCSTRSTSRRSLGPGSLGECNDRSQARRGAQTAFRPLADGAYAAQQGYLYQDRGGRGADQHLRHCHLALFAHEIGRAHVLTQVTNATL